MEELPEQIMKIIKMQLSSSQMILLMLCSNWLSFYRKSFKSPVIAVTGSAGKTVVKEWLADILGLTTPLSEVLKVIIPRLEFLFQS